VLNVSRFVEIFGDIENMVAKLVWLPTWHQARLVCSDMGVPAEAVSTLWQNHGVLPDGEELLHLYGVILDALIEKNFTAYGGRPGRLEKLSVAALIERMGDISDWPLYFTAAVLRVYQQFIEAYLNILRQQEQKPPDWFPRVLSIDPGLADGMRHFYSDSQHITRKFFKLNEELDLLLAIDRDNQASLHQDKIDDIIELCTV